MTVKKRVILIILAAVLVAGAFVGGFFVGKNNTKKETDLPNCEVVYAEIISVNGANFHVKG
ncbi:MAG: hypothetical protein ACI4JZ_00460, partial [Oscillospiraceae bacterium]